MKSSSTSTVASDCQWVAKDSAASATRVELADITADNSSKEFKAKTLDDVLNDECRELANQIEIIDSIRLAVVSDSMGVNVMTVAVGLAGGLGLPALGASKLLTGILTTIAVVVTYIGGHFVVSFRFDQNQKDAGFSTFESFDRGRGEKFQKRARLIQLQKKHEEHGKKKYKDSDASKLEKVITLCTLLSEKKEIQQKKEEEPKRLKESHEWIIRDLERRIAEINRALSMLRGKSAELTKVISEDNISALIEVKAKELVGLILERNKNIEIHPQSLTRIERKWNDKLTKKEKAIEKIMEELKGVIDEEEWK